MDGQKAILNWWKGLKKPFRLVFIDEDNIQELHSMRSSGLNLLLIAVGVCFAVFALTLFLLSITPIKYYLPGVGNVKNHPEYIELNRRVIEMENALQGQQKYLQQLQTILGNPSEETLDDNSKKADNDDVKAEIATVSVIPGNELISAKTALSHLSFTAPVRGTISQAFSADKRHYGTDLIAPLKTPVKAILEGRVVFSDWTLDGGNTLVIQHASNLLSVYKHNERLTKMIGAYVKTGEQIAIIGNSGLQTDGPHLHLELWYAGKAINPADWINLD